MQLRIIDFGLSKMVERTSDAQLVLGTPYYLAPEVFNMEGRNEAYNKPLDCWSAGILMYLLFAGEFPFRPPDLNDKICSERVDFGGPRWQNVSAQAKALIRSLLTKEPQYRFNARNALDHAFFDSIRQEENTQLE